MNDTIGAPAPAWLRIVAALGLAWNLFGCYAYLQTVGALAGADPGMTSAGMPAWVIGCFAVSVFGGALGSLGLLLLKRWAVHLLLLSLLCLIAQDIWAFVLSDSGPDKSPILPIVINLVAILLAWLAVSARRKGWLS
jgi:hypothetical protein